MTENAKHEFLVPTSAFRGNEMKLYYILVQPIFPENKPLSAMNDHSCIAHETYVTTHLTTFQSYLIDNPGHHSFVHDNAFYYVQSSATHIAVCVTDSTLSAFAQQSLFSKIIAASSNKALQKLLSDPAIATQTSTEKILHELDVLKQQMASNLDKIIERGQKIDDLQIKADQLQETSNQFKIKSTELKRSIQCPSLFSLFYAVKNLFWREAATYQFEPTEKPQHDKKPM